MFSSFLLVKVHMSTAQDVAQGWNLIRFWSQFVVSSTFIWTALRLAPATLLMEDDEGATPLDLLARAPLLQAPKMEIGRRLSQLRMENIEHIEN